MSVDSIEGHLAFQKLEVGNLDYPLCSDFFPHGDVAQRYGIFREGPPLPGISERAVIIINKEGRIVFRKVYDLSDLPEIDELLAALRPS